MATTICLEVSVGVDVSEAALEYWVFSQLNMPVVSAGQGPALLAEDLDAIDEFGGEIGVQRFIPVVAELCSAEVES
jgi:hypothetical protein